MRDYRLKMLVGSSLKDGPGLTMEFLPLRLKVERSLFREGHRRWITEKKSLVLINRLKRFRRIVWCDYSRAVLRSVKLFRREMPSHGTVGKFEIDF